MADYIFKRSEFKRPDVQLEHVEATIAFYEDHVEAKGVLTLTARKPMSEVELDFNGGKLKKPIGREVAEGERFDIAVENSFEPSDSVLYGIYRDVTPAGCPQQYMSQCQQFGFQRIMPVVDDCTAKCTFRTRLEGDARYTHLVSNGDLVEEGTCGEGRKFVVYENRQRMAPYLFIACAGTWEVLRDEVTYPDTGRKVKLEYLVPPGHIEGAREPMRILKESVIFQHELTGFVYPYETYRTICMEKSLYGGMENTGNTTIITEAALIDDTIGDRRLVYANGVIPHEYEHSHCGSGVTMESVFDMWLNEAYTVNVERAYVSKVFGEAFSRRLDIEELRRTGGALSEEECGTASPVVREGVNDPDEVVDAITYDKAPEVLNTLRALLGDDVYDRAWKEYFRRFSGGNANTDQCLDVFSEVSGRDVRALIGPYLFKTGFPTVRAKWSWADGKITMALEQDGDFTVPVRWAMVKGGKDVASGTFVLDGRRQMFTAPCGEPPDFVSWNRGCGFYGVLEVECPSEELERQVRGDPDCGNRIDALAMLRDRNEVDRWLSLYTWIFDSDLPIDEKAELLRVSDDSLARSRRGFVVENDREMRALRRKAGCAIGIEKLNAALGKYATGPNDLSPKAIVRRAYQKTILDLLAALDRPEANDVIICYCGTASNITARLNALSALMQTSGPVRNEIVAVEGERLRKSLNGYLGYLGVVTSDPHETLFARIAEEERREGWSINHPGLSRALYCGAARNNAQIWTDRGLKWLGETIVKYGAVSEYNALRIFAPLQAYRSFPPELSAKVRKLLEKLAAEMPSDKFPALSARIAKLLA